MILNKSDNYRKDIDGLRAYAVFAVVIFHIGYLPNGFLGVDVFFVISGYLITGIIYRKLLENNFSIKDFYVRRTKRIIPLVSFFCVISLLLGLALMLPDDLENLAQSVIATNLFNNNTLQVLTTRNYWNTINEFKPLMHTWSLAIEEQYYLFYPFLLLFLAKIRINLILPILILLTILSIGLFFSPFQDYYKFYLLPFRFFELSLGGIVVITLNGKIIHNQFSILLFFALIIILCLELNFVNEDILLFLTVIITCGILISDNKINRLSAFLLENKYVVFIGKISFSIYMWHQVLLAFGRYAIFPEMNIYNSVIIVVITILLSTATYYIIEQPFRDKINTGKTLWILTLVFLTTTTSSLYIYLKGGVLKDIPELGIKKELAKRKMHSKYNDDIYKLNQEFNTTTKVKILVIGNSFARDWCNVLLESKFKEDIQLSYIFDPSSHPNLDKRVSEADYVFVSIFSKKMIKELNIDESKIWSVGTKNFGVNNGLFYNYTGTDYCLQRTRIEKRHIEINNKLKREWGDKYIDLIELVIDDKRTVPVFTNECKFISQDCRHLTKYGAKYFALLIETNPKFILNQNK